MKKIVLVIVFMCFLNIKAQKTIEVARLFVVNIYFEEEIEMKNVDLGDPLYFEIKKIDNRFSITINPELALSERVTNVTFVAKSGNIYTMLLKSVKQPSLFNIPIKMIDATIKKVPSLSIKEISVDSIVDGKVVSDPKHYYSLNTAAILEKGSEVIGSEKTPTDVLYEKDKKEYYKKKIFYTKAEKPDFYRYYGRNGKVYLRLHSICYNKNELYLFLKIDNQEGLDFDINTIRASIGTNKKKKNTYQKIKKEPLFSYDVPNRIEGMSEHLFVLVFERIALDKNKSFYIELDELNGGRNISLEIERKILSNPKKF